MKIVMVKFRDSKFITGAWTCKEHLMERPCMATAIGVVHDTGDDFMVVCGGVCEGEYSQCISMPKGAILSVKQLKAVSEVSGWEMYKFESAESADWGNTY